MESVSRADIYRTADRDMILEPAAFSDGDLRPDYTIRANNHIRSNPGVRVHDGGRMNRHCSTNANVSVPSETTSPFTRHRQLAFPTLAFALKSSASTTSISPGVTGFRNLMSSALKKYPIPSVRSDRFRSRMLATWAIASTCKTPGITGCPGKWP